jgi:hypothetical protein
MPEGRLSVGNVEILALTDQADVDYDQFPLLNQLFPDVPMEAWAPYQQRYPEASVVPISGAPTTAVICCALGVGLFW